MVHAGRTAKVTATPAESAVATCRVILDKTLDQPRQLAERTSTAPGQPVTCEEATPG
ncbi:hypothetical protein GCM10012275_45250 [Longimycelium tulufanense]|uniref:Uncharacterized protein n=1 Tax=Longimycelium tulufanense TaxID=907463 RepID=A0A8J3CHV2_9PSEU|nr:hypothetical protein [Longimycelium tulufanense]GGM69723.1 hypothetical protein GCM10012275_45250 [Longimycelium tulufanense]